MTKTYLVTCDVDSADELLEIILDGSISGLGIGDLQVEDYEEEWPEMGGGSVFGPVRKVTYLPVDRLRVEIVLPTPFTSEKE
jgi:hypothetical protein